MMTQQRTVAFLLPGMLLFFGLTVMLFRLPAEYPLISLLFTAFVLATALAISLEMASIFGVLVTLIELGGLGMVQGQDKAWLAGQMALMWISVYVAHRFILRDLNDDGTCAEALRQRQQAMISLQREKESLAKRWIELQNQAALRQHLSNAVHQLASLMDPVMVRQRLMEFVRSTINQGTIHYFAGNAPRDLLDKWVMERKLSLLVTDISQDSRFKLVRSTNEVRSVLAAPIVVERQMVGIIRLNGFEPGMFSVGDLRILEALSLLASLALENLQLLARLQEGAIRDNLTGLYTHRFFEERLNEEILRAGRYHTEFCLLMMDIDHFKRYNDTYGHAAGDQVLVRVSQVLQQIARPVDLLARYGGEEFVLILPQTDLSQAREIAERIRQSIEGQSFQFGPEATMQEHVTISVGVSGFPQEATIASQLVRVADYRLYQAKEGGRNRVVG
ncbi:MAG: GGDEF domain-containing protein [Elusimicrobiota bacterium]|jgi:diguanylate cyclase (GGDEF)-like protein